LEEQQGLQARRVILTASAAMHSVNAASRSLSEALAGLHAITGLPAPPQLEPLSTNEQETLVAGADPARLLPQNEADRLPS
jgi:hypothetical protein